MIVKKSYYDILVYLIKNTAMKARPVAGDEHGIWQCWVPELEKIVPMDDGDFICCVYFYNYPNLPCTTRVP